MEKICPKCGASNKEKTFVGAFCIDCANIKLEPPKKITIHVCKECNRIKIKKKWMPYSIKAIESEIKRLTKGEFEDMVLNINTGELKFVIKVEGNFIEVKKKINIKLIYGLCNKCTGSRGGYYEGIIQIRMKEEKKADTAKIKRIADKLIKAINKESFVSKIVELKEGIDLYIGDKRKAIEILSFFGLKYKRTRKLYGLKKGKRVYRDTFLIRV